MEQVLARMEPDTSRAAKWSRRVVTVPGLVLLCLVDLALLPLLLLGALVMDLARRRRFAGVRFQLAVAFALSIHVVGLVLLLRAWIAGMLAGPARERDLDVWSEDWWATATWHTAVRLYGMRVVVEGEDALDGGPLVLMSRHASLLDILLPIVVAARHDLALRYVVKRELLWDPCIDLVGHRIATAFVRRQGRGHEVDVAAVESLARDLGPRDAVVIFPEGTRFSEAKRTRALAALAGRDEAAFANAQRLQNLLPPHPAGPLHLLDRAPRADVVFCAHTGLEGANHLRDLVAGSLIGSTVRVHYWRVKAHEIPPDATARLQWLRQWWERLDAWIDEAKGRHRDCCVVTGTGGRP